MLQAVRKVIAAMSVGKDVSSLFADVINCVQSTSIEMKKLVYLYVINYAKAQPDLAILAVNTFRKDSLDPNPLIRALAVRTMGYIRLEAVAEYLMDPVRRCCRDTDPYVRKTAAICVGKLFAIAPVMVEEQGFIDLLQKELIVDANPMVVSNSVAALNEISNMSGRNRFDFISNSDMANTLLNALNECNEWAQVIILDALSSNYKPSDSKEAITAVDRVTARLSHSNSAVVLSAVRFVVGLLDRVGSVEAVRSVCKKLTGPLITLLAESEPEIQYIALRNISLIMTKFPAILAGEVKVFFCKYNDPVYVKLEKLEAMIQLGSDKTADSVLSELKEYASEVDLDFVRKSVRCIGRFAIRVESAADKCVSALLELIETKISYVVQEAVIVMRDVFRRFPGRYESVISALCDNLEVLDEPEAKSAMIWILGEYSDRIDNSRDLIDSFLTTFLEEPYLVQLELLTASVKYFLKVQGASHGTLVKVLSLCTEETENPDIRDRAFVYWRLLSLDPDLCRKCIVGPKPLIVDDIGHTIEGETMTKLIKKIGTLSSVYHLVPASFVVRNSKNPNNEDEDLDSEEEYNRAQTLQKLKGQIMNKVEPNQSDHSSSSDDDASDDDSSSSSASSSEDDTISSEIAPDLKISKLSVLSPTTVAGGNGSSGLGIDACFAKKGLERYLFLSIRNGTSAPLSSFALQFNKNSFGLGPKTSNLDVGNGGVLNPGMVVDVSVPLDVNKLNSGTPPPADQLTVQVAVRTNMDVFYFVVPFDLHVVLEKGTKTGITRSNFSISWDALVSSEKTIPVRTQGIPNDKLIMRLAQGGLGHVGSGMTFSGITCNKLTVLIELMVNENKCRVRATNIHVVTHACTLLSILLGR
jgi:AP-1 complex subunit beta-1